MQNNRTALIIGSTGMVGEQCLRELLACNSYSKVVALTRSKLTLTHPKLENRVSDFDRLENVREWLNCDDVYCAIGTTIAKAGSQEAFRKVDYEYPLKVAQLALWNGAKRFILVSALGASASSPVFYNRVKGELEQALMQLGYEALIILRPSILLGNRKEQRTGEAAGMWVAEKLPFLFCGPFKKYRGTPAVLVAQVMVKLGASNSKGVQVLENENIFEEAER
ncbi:MAG: oxidoreductase [Chitinophagales bacterium]|nr:oxidoreductase [Chitinophagales bacterium]